MFLCEDVFQKVLEKKVDELAAENRELLTLVDEGVRIAEEFKQKAFLMGENLVKSCLSCHKRHLCWNFVFGYNDASDFQICKYKILINRRVFNNEKKQVSLNR